MISSDLANEIIQNTNKINSEKKDKPANADRTPSKKDFLEIISKAKTLTGMKFKFTPSSNYIPKKKE